MSQIKVRTTEDGALPINHELAGIVPMATPEQQILLMEDIEQHGQREPIVLWHGKVIDGRCRQKALTSLNRFILYKELDEQLTYDEVKAYVKSVNTRRDLTATQKVAVAAKEYRAADNKKTKKLVAKAWGLSDSMLDNGIWLVDYYPLVLEELFKGNSVEIINTKGFKVTSSRVTAIYAYYKKLSEGVKQNTRYGWQADTFIESQAAKEWYYDTIRELEKRLGTLDTVIKQNHAELANYKFPLPSKE